MTMTISSTASLAAFARNLPAPAQAPRTAPTAGSAEGADVSVRTEDHPGTRNELPIGILIDISDSAGKPSADVSVRSEDDQGSRNELPIGILIDISDSAGRPEQG